LAHDIAYHALDCAFVFALIAYCELRLLQVLDDGYGGLRVHLPCPLYGLSCRELRPVPIDVFLYPLRDGRLVDDCAGLAMRQYTKLRAL